MAPEADLPLPSAAALRRALRRARDGAALDVTEAAVLLAARGGFTTGELAGRVGVSVAAISHHTAVLRDAGLITSIRAGNTVRHSLTRLGQALVHRHATIREDPEFAVRDQALFT